MKADAVGQQDRNETGGAPALTAFHGQLRRKTLAAESWTC